MNLPMFSCMMIILFGLLGQSFIIHQSYSSRSSSPLTTLDEKVGSFISNRKKEEFLASGKLPRLKNVESPVTVKSLAQLQEFITQGYRVRDIDVRGDIHSALNEGRVHPIVKLLHERRIAGSKPNERNDGKRIALAIEGGGMRGCVTAGMAVAVWHLGLQDSIDVVYGSSAGAIVGAYFITQQLPYEGPEIYYDILTTSGKAFIDSRSILRSSGLGILDLRPKSLLSLLKDRVGKPVLNLDFVCHDILQQVKPLNWTTFWTKQVSNRLPLKVVVSGLLSETSIALSAAEDNFHSVNELADCIKASMALPGITGDVVRLRGSQVEKSHNVMKVSWKEHLSRLKSDIVYGSEPLSDALIFEPLPYRSALKENCTHVIVLRSRADDISVTVKMSKIERMIMDRFFGRKLKLPRIQNWMRNQFHKLIYAEDILRLNEDNRNYGSLDSVDGPKLFGVALPAGNVEVKRMETSRKVIFDNVKAGFAAAYDSLVDDPSLRGQGAAIADTIWPEELLERPPSYDMAKVLNLDNSDTMHSPPKAMSKRKALSQRAKKLFLNVGNFLAGRSNSSYSL